MRLVSLTIDEQLFTDLLGSKAFPRLFHLKNNLLFFQKEIHARRRTSITWRPFLGSNVIKIEVQQRMNKVLDIIFIGNV